MKALIPTYFPSIGVSALLLNAGVSNKGETGFFAGFPGILLDRHVKTFTDRFRRYLILQESLCKLMLIFLGVSMTILILLQIFFRFVVYVPFPWSEECARYLMIWMGMLGSVAALQKGRHIGVMVFMKKLPIFLQRQADLLVKFILIGFLCILLWQGVKFALFNFDQLSPAMEIPMLIPYISVPTAALMMILVIIGDILEIFYPVGLHSRGIEDQGLSGD